jgi:polysaccharide export outer membrane protein
MGTNPTYTLHPGDTLYIEMYLEPENRTETRVSQDGYINLNLINQVKVGGLTVQGAKELITEKYREYFKDPQITIIIKEYAPRQVYVHGFVNRAGPVPFPFEGDLTLSRAIAIAGGLQPRASRTDVKIRRVVDGKQTTTTKNLADIDSGKAPDVYLIEDDAIYVEDSVI